MLKKFEVKNYANFKDTISIDFSKVGGYHFSKDCISNQMISKMLIYGRNATGKTNLGKAVTDIRDTLILPGNQPVVFLNADSTAQKAEFRYTFQFGNDQLEYVYHKKDSVTLCYEALHVNQSKIFSNSFFEDGWTLSLGQELWDMGINKDRYEEVINDGGYLDNGRHGTLPFLRWLINNSALPEDSILLKFYHHVRGMFMLSLQTQATFAVKQAYGEFFKQLYKDDSLKDLEDFLNAMGVNCQLELHPLPGDVIELYFKHSKPVPFIETASSGTMALLSLYRRFYSLNHATFMYIDEFDAFYHYEMSENMISYLKHRFPECQIILTTHNTNLMTNKIMRPDCLFILSTLGTLTPLCAATPRELREGHNLEKMYISGEFADYE